MKKRNIKNALLALLLVVVMGASMISAYFTATDTKTNTFEVGKISIDLQEPSWNGTVDTTPNATTKKDPQILNDGNQDAYVYLTVDVPYANVKVADLDGTVNEAKDTELFSYTVNEGWTLVETTKDEEAGVYRHVYAYASDASTLSVLKPDVTTSTLFDEIKFANVVENQGLELTEQNVVVNAYGIETTIIGGEATPEYVWQVITNQVLSVSRISGENDIILAGDLPAGTYTLRYEDENGVIEDYADICSLDKKDSDKNAVYKGFIAENSAPVEATVIGVYNSSDERVDEIALGSLDSSDLGEKLYSFAPISDTHIGSNTAEDDLKNALQYFENDSDIKFTTISGDLATSGSAGNLSLYKSIVNTYTTKPVYAISGNHEAGNGYLSMDSLHPYTGQDLYYSFTEGDDVFIMVGMYDVHEGQEFAPGELEWLYETLEANRDKNCFVFMHLFPGEGSGDAVDLDIEGDMLDNTQGEVFYSLMSHYSNVTWFHGHSHQEFEIQEVNEMNNYDDIFGIHSVHIPSLAYPKYISGSSLETDYDGSQGYIVDVYENNIVLRGIDFASGKFLPIATYSLDTTIKNVEADTYVDSTGTIVNSNSNVLKSGSTWYNSSVDKSTITEISFVEEYSETSYDESWDASISNNSQVVAYRTGTELTIVGNEKGISANSDSSQMFSGFKNLTQINGFENLDTSNITKLNAMFKNCSKLTSIDLSNFDDVKPEDMVDVFNGCSSLTSADVSNFDLTDVGKYMNLFYNCSSLKEVKLPNDASSNRANVYFASSFKGCSSLTKIDMTMFSGKTMNLVSTFSGCTSLNNVKFGENKVPTLNATFENCSSLEKLDISGFDVSNCENTSRTFENCQSLKTLILPEVFDTSKVTTMMYMFNGCSLLTLDCSKWDTSSLTLQGASSSSPLTDFNTNAPGVIAPVWNE